MDIDVFDGRRKPRKRDKPHRPNMATLMKAVHISRTTVYNLSKLFSNLSLTSNVNFITKPIHIRRVPLTHCALIHTTSVKNDLMEFFDEEDNWGKEHVRVGRAWKVDELRIKSNEDLHKLWYVLLKERNMLFTMEEVFRSENMQLPNPERIDKVDVGMKNIETVVRERNKAYFMLETGVSGERPARMVYSTIGLKTPYRMTQHIIPKWMNTGWKKTYKFGFKEVAVRKFLRLYREKLFIYKRKERNRQYNQATSTLRIFPDCDLEALQKKYPLVNIQRVVRLEKSRGHSVTS